MAYRRVCMIYNIDSIWEITTLGDSVKFIWMASVSSASVKAEARMGPFLDALASLAFRL